MGSTAAAATSGTAETGIAVTGIAETGIAATGIASTGVAAVAATAGATLPDAAAVEGFSRALVDDFGLPMTCRVVSPSRATGMVGDDSEESWGAVGLEETEGAAPRGAAAWSGGESLAGFTGRDDVGVGEIAGRGVVAAAGFWEPLEFDGETVEAVG